jgi:hypothetical protein
MRPLASIATIIGLAVVALSLNGRGGQQPPAQADQPRALGAEVSRTRISHLICPVTPGYINPLGQQTERPFPPCWAVDVYEAKLVAAGYCYRPISSGMRLWQQCQRPPPTPSKEFYGWEGGNAPCLVDCRPAPGYPPLPWGHENLPCAEMSKGVEIEHDSNDPRFTLQCAAGATLLTDAYQAMYLKEWPTSAH